MESNTGLDAVSRAVPDSATMSDKDMAEKRADTMKKVVMRLQEVAGRVDAITAAAKAVLPDLIAKDPLGAVVDHLEDLDLVINGHKGAQTVGLDERLSELKAVLAYAKEVSMPARMDAEEIKTFNTADNRVTRTERTFASIVDQERAFEWLRTNGYEMLIKETVNSSSLSSAAKELMEGGRELPGEEDGGPFKVFIKDGISITRKRK